MRLLAASVDRVKDGRRQDSVAGRGRIRGSRGVGRVRGRRRQHIAPPVSDVIDVTATETAGTVRMLWESFTKSLFMLFNFYCVIVTN